MDAVDERVERRLEDLLAGVPAFSFALARVAELADAAVLLPEPAAPFRALTRLIWDEWPECPPYGGAFDDIAPHVTVVVDPTAGERETIEEALAPRLPLAVPRHGGAAGRGDAERARCASAGASSSAPDPASALGGRAGQARCL